LLISPLFLRCDLCLREGDSSVFIFSVGGNAAKIACHNELPQKLCENASPPHCPAPQSQLHALNYVTSKSRVSFYLPEATSSVNVGAILLTLLEFKFPLISSFNLLSVPGAIFSC
jgi:hypothetical protein